MNSPLLARYESDFYEWSMQQAALVRTLAGSRLNVDIDCANIAEEIEDMGKAERRAVGSQVRRILYHLLKLQHSPATEPRRGWQNSVDDARVQLAEHLGDSPSLVHDMAGSIEHQYALARRRALRDLEVDGIDPRLVPATCPYTELQIRDSDWWPEPPKHP